MIWLKAGLTPAFFHARLARWLCHFHAALAHFKFPRLFTILNVI